MMRALMVLFFFCLAGGGALAQEEDLRRDDVKLGDPFRGKALFVSEGCVMCHAVRGVGGEIAPALDANESLLEDDPYTFAARMWRGAPLMVEVQELELGYRIDLSGQDLADLTAFANGKEVQATFTIEDVPSALQDWFLDADTVGRGLRDKAEGRDEPLPLGDNRPR